ncbi:MAG: sensor histidine kinase, partial [Kordiimonas sp.]
MSGKKAYSETDVEEPKASSADRVRHIIGELYYEQFDILIYLTILYYSLVTIGDVLAAANGMYALIAIDLVVVGILLITLALERRGLVNIGNIYLTPIPLGIGMAANVYMHIYYSTEPFVLVKGILLIFAFGIVSLLPWIFWLLLAFSFGAYAAAAVLKFGDASGVALGLGAGVAMLSYGGFAMRYNSVRKQIALTIQNEERAQTLEEVGKAKDSFIANMSHELRTPLTGLLGMIDVIDAEGLNDEQKKQLAAARTSAGTLQAIIADLLDVSSLDAGKLTLKPAPFNVDETVYSVVLAVQSLVKRDVKFTYDAPTVNLPHVVGDVSRFRQILFNLVGNALKFTDQGSVVLGVKVLSEGETVKIRCSVEDTGIGIPADKLEHLFDRFEQVDSSATRGRAGTGLGLAIAQELVILMGGEIKVESELNRGTR